MPWTAADAEKHKKGLSDKQKRQWANVANSALSSCLKEGKDRSKCEASAIKQANSTVGTPKEDKELLADEVEPNTEKGWVPWGVTSWEQLDQARDAQEYAMRLYDTTDDFFGLVRSIIDDPAIDNKESAIDSAANGFKSRIRRDEWQQAEQKSWFDSFKSSVKEFLSGKQKTDSDMLLWKEADGSYRWFARYSNNFRDDDRPREIISAKSHERFVELVDKGVEPYPELWIWHVPEWKVGEAKWLAYDDTGFALAYGTIDRGKEAVAEWLAKQKGIRTSHGMPSGKIKRDSDDPTIIVEHVTREISPLPAWAAANPLTGFVVFNKSTENEEEDMIPQKKVKALVDQWQVDPTLLNQLAEQNALDAEQANAEGRDRKEKDDVATSEPAVAVPEQAQEQVPTPETDTPQPEVEPVAAATGATDSAKETGEQPITRAEVAEAIVPIYQLVKELTNQLTIVSNELAALKQKPADAQPPIDNKQLPAASLAALISQQTSAIGAPETRVGARDPLAKSRPEETAPDAERRTGIPVIDQFLVPRQ